MTTVHSYARFSSDRQAEGDSTRRQTHSAQDFCNQHNHTLGHLRYSDNGKSGFRGNKQKALQALLKSIETGQIRAGDILYVEAIDRLSRKELRDTQTLVLSILNADVSIAISIPYARVYRADNKNSLGDAIELAAFSHQAHTYSKNLSDRIKAKHVQARKDARMDGKKPFGIIPAWLEKSDDRFTIKPGATEAIHFVFHRSIEGIGNKILCQELNATFPALGRSKKWNETYIRNLIRERTVLGEYQPHVLDENGQRQPVGDVIADYYPSLVDENTWLAANQAMNHRRIEKGPSGKFINLFTGIVWHALDNCSAHTTTYQQKRADGRKVIIRRLKSYHAIQGIDGASTPTVDMPAFEDAVLTFLPEIDASVFEGNNRCKELELKAKQAELHQKKQRWQELESALLGNTESVTSLLKQMAQLELESKSLQAEVDALAPNGHRSPAQALEQIRTLNGMTKTPENRQKLREAIKQVIEVINIAPVKLGEVKRDPVACAIEIIFHGGHRRLLLHCNKRCIAYTDSFRDMIPETERLTSVNKPWLRQLAKAARLLFVVR
ncbi:MAG TPA: recombinase family protein [Pirellulaceae bacterium]|nr:recombinase family protein [Pirellulaceae bacterium]